MAWRMPAETAPQERIWMAFPPAESYIADSPSVADETRRAWSRVAHTVAEIEPVTMVVDPAGVQDARRYLSSAIEIVEAPLNDAWMRDIGPSFVLDEDGALGSVEWAFNGWGQQEWARWDKDSAIGQTVGQLAAASSIPSALVTEGGAIHVDGEGTVLVTRTSLLDPARNPALTQSDIEAEFARTIGADHVVWLPRSLYRDWQTLGSHGHVDMIAAIPSPGRVLVHSQPDTAHPDHLITREAIEVLRAGHDAAGRAWDVIELPAPKVTRDDQDWVDYNYVNHLVVNGAVIACTFEDPNDDQAREILADAYPGREIIAVDARGIFAGGGGIHCITQQQPRARTSKTAAQS